MRTSIRLVLLILTVIGVAHYVEARRELPAGAVIGGCAAKPAR